jgi:hypothetical protein
MQHVSVFRRCSFLLLCLFLAAAAQAQVQITFPTTRAVFQRDNANRATVSVGGQFSVPADKIEARFVPRQAGQGTETAWTPLANSPLGGTFLGEVSVPGGWYNLEVRASFQGTEVGRTALERVGVGEVLVVAGQSNAQGLDNKNPPEPQDDRVNCVGNFFNESRQGTDPARLPVFTKMTAAARYGTNGVSAWAWGTLGDLLTQRLNVPVLFLNAGFGASTIQNWRESAEGQRTVNIYCAECADEFKYFTNGIPYVNLKIALNYYTSLLGVRGVLWHQGETDNIPLRSSTDHYRDNLRRVIEVSRQHAGRNLSWMVARASLASNNAGQQVPGEAIIEAQNQVIAQVPNVFAGPQTDNVQNPRPDGVHFEGEGHRQHAQAWFDALNATNFFSTSQPHGPAAALPLTVACSGTNQLQLSLPGGQASYAWSDSQTGEVVSQASLAGVPGRTYYPRAKDASGNSRFGVPFTVPAAVSSPAPTITADGPLQVCGGTGSVTLTSSAPLDNVWSNGATTRSITVSQAGSYTVRSRGLYGCLSEASAATTVSVFPGNPPPKPLITAGGATTFCPGGNVTLTASGTGTNFVWSNGATGRSITVNQTGTFTVRAVDGNNCGSPTSDPLRVTTQARPETPTVTAQGSTTFCPGGNVTLTASGTGTNFVWSNGATGRSITVNQAGSYSVRIQDGGTCQSDVSNSVTVTASAPVPAPTISSSTGSSAVCDGQTLTLTATDGASYVWSTGATTRTLSVREAGSYTVRIRNANGCESPLSAPFVVQVNPLPAATTITASGATTFCPDSSVVLTAAVANVVWSNSFPTQAVTVSQAGTYTARTRDANGCVSAPSNAITVVLREAPARPTVTSSGPTTFCIGGTVTLRAPEARTYEWSTGATTRDVVLAAGATVTLRVTGTNGCRSPQSAAVAVVVNPLPAKPSLTPDGATTFCAGGTLTLTAPAQARYAWNTGATDRSIRVTQSGRFAVRVTDANGCVSPSSDTLQVTVNPIPAQPRLSASGPTTFCADRNVVLTSSEEQAYEWSNGATTRSITVSEPGSYRVRTRNTFNCPSPYSEALTTTVYPLPAAPLLTAQGATTFCEGNQVTLCANTTLTTLWSQGTDSSSCIQARTSGAYTARIRDTRGCISAASNALTVDVKPLPDVPTITQVGTYTLEASATRIGDDYAWQRDGLDLTPRTQVIKAVTAGTYSVQTRLSYPLGNGSGTLVCLSRPSAALRFAPDLTNAGLSLYPNPTATGFINLETLEDRTNVRIRIFTLQGQQVAEETVPSFAERQRLALTLPPGTYLLTAEAAGFRTTKRFIIQ